MSAKQKTHYPHKTDCPTVTLGEAVISASSSVNIGIVSVY